VGRPIFVEATPFFQESPKACVQRADELYGDLENLRAGGAAGYDYIRNRRQATASPVRCTRAAERRPYPAL